MIEPGTLIAVLFLTAVLFILISALLAFKLRREKDNHRNTQCHLDDFMSSSAQLIIDNHQLRQQIAGVVDDEETHS